MQPLPIGPVHRHNRTLAAWEGTGPAFRVHAASLARCSGLVRFSPAVRPRPPWPHYTLLYHQALSYVRRFNWFSRSPDTKRATSPRVFGDATHRLIMDYTDIPNFALLRHGTVIVRLKMEVTSSCCQPQVHPVKGCANVVHRLSSCEQCTRTRLNKKLSDCDSELVDYRLPYKTRTAKSSKHLFFY